MALLYRCEICGGTWDAASKRYAKRRTCSRRCGKFLEMQTRGTDRCALDQRRLRVPITTADLAYWEDTLSISDWSRARGYNQEQRVYK